MNCPSCQADNLTDYPVCPTCATTCHVEHRKCLCDTCKWIDYRDAAKLMRRPQDYFRMRNADGSYKHFPAIERWQPGGRGTRMFVRRADVDRWIEASRTPARPRPVSIGAGYESARPVMERLGAYGTMKAFGLK